jgi:hypothetical protein
MIAYILKNGISELSKLVPTPGGRKRFRVFYHRAVNRMVAACSAESAHRERSGRPSFRGPAGAPHLRAQVRPKRVL